MVSLEVSFSSSVERHALFEAAFRTRFQVGEAVAQLGGVGETGIAKSFPPTILLARAPVTLALPPAYSSLRVQQVLVEQTVFIGPQLLPKSFKTGRREVFESIRL